MTPSSSRGREERPQRRDVLTDRTRQQAASGEPGDVLAHVTRLDCSEAHSAEEGERAVSRWLPVGVEAEGASIVVSRPLAEAAGGPARVARDPIGGELGEGDAGDLTELAAADVGGKRRLQRTGLRKGSRGALPLSAGRVAVDNDVTAAALVDGGRRSLLETAGSGLDRLGLHGS